MRTPRKAAAVVLAALVAATASPSAAGAAPKAAKSKHASATCKGSIAEGVGDPYLFGSPVFAGRGLMGFLVVPDNGKITVDAVADSWSGLYHNEPGSRDAFRLVTKGLSYRSNWTGEVLPLDGTTAWIPKWTTAQDRKWTRCTPGLTVIPFDPTA